MLSADWLKLAGLWLACLKRCTTFNQYQFIKNLPCLVFLIWYFFSPSGVSIIKCFSIEPVDSVGEWRIMVSPSIRSLSNNRDSVIKLILLSFMPSGTYALTGRVTEGYWGRNDGVSFVGGQPVSSDPVTRRVAMAARLIFFLNAR